MTVDIQSILPGPEETCCPTLLPKGPQSICLLPLETLDTQVEMGWGVGESLEDGSDNAEPSLPPQEQCITFDRVLSSDAAQVGGVVGRREVDGNP